MKGKKWTALLLTVLMLLGLTACGEDTAAVFVQQVSELNPAGGLAAGDRFGGIVVSEQVAEIRKDGDKTVAELFVREGDDVAEGQVLFTYDTDELQLSLDKLLLEQEQLTASIESYTVQIAELEEARQYVSSGDALEYTVQIQTLQVDLTEAELNLKAKEAEVARARELLDNAEVVSPVTGRVQAVSEEGYDMYGNEAPYITIQKSGAYRVKGILGELQLGSILEGSRIRILSRTDGTQMWTGTVTLIDYENPTQGSSYDMYYGMGADEMTSSSRYPFYIEPDDTEGLMLGQHVYLELDTGEAEDTGLSVSAAFFCFEEDGSAYVWAEKRGRLEKRPVVLGEYDMMNDTYPVIEGLSGEDYVAFPDETVCREGAPTTHAVTVQEPGTEAEVG